MAREFVFDSLNLASDERLSVLIPALGDEPWSVPAAEPYAVTWAFIDRSPEAGLHAVKAVFDVDDQLARLMAIPRVDAVVMADVLMWLDVAVWGSSDSPEVSSASQSSSETTTPRSEPTSDTATTSASTTASAEPE